ncbi:caspase domain-containing protein [Mycena metata]|uniref:Caspase domain-containing protein n=1 Tax=Mycena metata TaxID=1033252 RepID=A0AAD7IFQ0_9AGAR|nr:caspase domain-containing protein [Mycena metata]
MGSTNPRVFALIIAIDKYAHNDSWKLNECVNDANLIESFITTTFTTHSIRRLDNEAATRQDILDNFRSHLIENTNINPGDTIIFYFAGHGSRVTGPVGWESNDGLIETICPYDQRARVNEVVKGAPGIPDVTMAALLHELVSSRGNNIIVILDSCHSGGATRSTDILGRYLPPDDLPFPDIDRAIWTRDSSNFDSTTKPPRFGGIDCQYVLLAACGERQTAFDGYFTRFLVKGLNQKPSTYADLLAMVPPKRDGSGNAVQHPQCEWNKNRLLFTTLVALDNKAFRLTKTDDGRYTVAAWAIHGVQLDMFFRVDSPPTVLRVTQILTSSSILEAHDASTDIPSGVAAFPTMNLGMKVFLEPPFALPPDLSTIDSCFTIVPVRQHADLILRLESLDSGEKLRIESLDPLLRHLSCHVTHMDWNEVRHHLPRSLDAIAHFRYHLGRHSDHGDPYTASEMSTHVADHIFSDSELEISLLRLGPMTFRGFRESEQPERNLLSLFDRTATLRNQEGIKYGIRLRSKPLQSHLFFYVFYMDPSDFSIQAWHLPKPPPNPASKIAHIGYGAGGGFPIEFDLEGKDYDAGFLKVFISTEYADMSSMEQNSAAAQRLLVRRAPVDITGIWGAWLGAITVSAGGGGEQ